MAEVYEIIDAMSLGCILDRIINIGSQAPLWRGPLRQSGCDGNAVDRLRFDLLWMNPTVMHA